MDLLNLLKIKILPEYSAERLPNYEKIGKEVIERFGFLLDADEINNDKNSKKSKINQKDENIILPDIKNALYMTKETVEKKVLENKKGNIFAKSFSFFFGAKEEDKKDELTEEETEISSDIYNYDNIFKYLKEKSNINVDSFSSIISKIKNFFCDFSAEINFEKLELILQNYSSETQNLFIKGMKTNFDFFNKEFEFGLFINDIG